MSGFIQGFRRDLQNLDLRGWCCFMEDQSRRAPVAPPSTAARPRMQLGREKHIAAVEGGATEQPKHFPEKKLLDSIAQVSKFFDQIDI